MAGRWERIEELFAGAQEQPAGAREAWLAAACDDAELRAEVAAMLAADAPLSIERLAGADPMVGARLGPWRVTAPLGRGGMGTVYLAERADGQYAQRAALKLVSTGSFGPEAAERFRTERQVLARLAHPSIARLLDGGVAADGRPYLVMELIDGVPITEYCAARGLSVAERLRLFRTVCEAVQHAHGALVVHRDLKPANTLVSSAGEVKLLDFGIAKLLQPAAFGLDEHETREQGTPLTLEYAAPEQLLGGPVTTATDVYSLGVLLYELLTGARPLDLHGKTPVEIERAMTASRIAPPSQRAGRRLGKDLDCIVLAALRAQPERRYVSAGQLGEEIGRFLDGQPVLARPDGLAYRARRFAGRNRAAVAAAALVAAAVLGFGVLALAQARRAARERDAARLERDKAEKVVGVLVDLFETSNPSLRPDGDKLTVRQFLAQAEPRVLGRLEGQPAIRARLRQVFGLIYSARDQYAEARKALEQALAEQRRLLGPDHPEAIESLYQLGMLIQHTDGEEPARPLLEESLARSLRVFGEDDERTARNLVALASPERLDEAGQLLGRALAIRRRVLPPDHPVIAENLGQLANYNDMRGRPDRARALYEEALGLFRTPESRRDVRALTLMSDFAALLGDREEPARAEALLRESLELAREVFGADSWAVAHRLNNLAVLLVSQGRLAEGEALFREAHARHVAILGEDHWRTINIARSEGWVLALQQRHDEALAWMDRAIAAARRSPPGDHPAMIFHMRGKRALILVRLGRGEEALRELADTTAALQDMKAQEAADVMTDLRLATALALIETGRPAEAEAPARAALAELSKSYAPRHPRRAGAECLVGWSLALGARREEGRAILGRCLPLYAGSGLADPRAVAGMKLAASLQ